MAIASDPEYPVVGEEVTLNITSPTGDTEATRFYLTTVPDRSALETGAVLDDGGDFAQVFTPDVQGAYEITAYDYRRRVVDEIRDDLVATQSGTVYVGAYADLPIVTIRGDGATLRLTVVNDTVRAAELINPLTEASRYAIKASAVVTALATLVDVDVTDLNPDMWTDVNEMLQIISAQHYKDESAHNVADDTNELSRAPTYNNDTARSLLVALSESLHAHMTGERDGGEWHINDDEKNTAVTFAGSTLASAVVHKADLRERVYERHRIQVSTPQVHDAVDNTNVLSAPGVLDAFLAVFLDELVNPTPAATSGEQEGAVDIGQMFGFEVQE